MRTRDWIGVTVIALTWGALAAAWLRSLTRYYQLFHRKGR